MIMNLIEESVRTRILISDVLKPNISTEWSRIMKKNLLSLALVAAAFFATEANAANYGMAGCGLGSMAFGNDNGKIQIVAHTTNGTFGSQTFGITSGTSNCVDSGASASAMYIAVNQESLKKDIARGEGETLNGLSQVLNCNDSAKLSNTLQQNYSSIFPTNSVKSEEINANIQALIQSNKELNGACTAGL